ncbi:MAG: glycoside hydrolase family 15 protein [Haloferacaceae archaeon]
MRLRTALNDYKGARADGERFPEEARTVDGALSGHGDRLVHVGPTGALRDHSTPLSGLSGVDRSRFGVRTPDGITWFDDLDAVRQHYYRETTLVETEYDAGAYTVHQYDLTLGRAHCTHVELRGAVPDDASLVAFMTLAPGNKETRVGRLIHENAGPDGSTALEVFHRTEHDYVAASTGLTDVRGQVSERFDELLDEAAFEFPRKAAIRRYEDTHLSGDVVVSAPFERAGRGVRTTLVTQLSDHDDVDRETALADLRNCASTHESADDLREAARSLADVTVPAAVPRSEQVRGDLRALDLLTAPSGARIAGPEFDPFYANSGGYGYTWFRDDARVTGHLLGADERFGLGITGRLVDAAWLYCETQLEDGTWPHRVWASDGSVAPGWANASLEGSRKPEYQPDQTASVVAVLARLLRTRRDELSEELVAAVRRTVAAGIDGLDAWLGDDGLPIPSENAWEDAIGRFTGTAGTYLEAYSEAARAPLREQVRTHARRRADTVYEAIADRWAPEEGRFIRRVYGEERDARFDADTFALVGGHEAYAALSEVEERRLDRLVAHVEATAESLYRETDDGSVRGLIRYEGDSWRTNGQSEPKVWSITTGWGAISLARLADRREARGDESSAEALRDRAAELYGLLGPDGPFLTASGHLAEQVFDDGEHDSATPIGWAHALRLETTARLDAADALPATGDGPAGPEERTRWTTGEKFGVGTVADHGTTDPSRVWYTLTAGALTEPRFPRVDVMNLRTLDFLVVDADADSTYTARTYRERRDVDDGLERAVEPTADEALCYRHAVREPGDGRGHEWTLTAEYAADPDGDALLADVRFDADDGGDYQVYVVGDVALTNGGSVDRGLRLGRPAEHHLVARDATAYDASGDVEEPEESVAVALTSSSRFAWASAEAAGTDRLEGLFGDGTRPESRTAADGTNVVLVGEVGEGRRVRETLALGFGTEADTAAALGEAQGALTAGFENVRSGYVRSWTDYLAEREVPESVADDPDLRRQYDAALMTLRACEDKRHQGASVASPSVPWGDAVVAGDERGYGYNFVWSRDLYQVATAHLAAGDVETPADALAYVYRRQQDETGFIPQNTYLDGQTRWGGEQMDNISYPAVLAYLLDEAGIGFEEADYGYRHVKRSADYVARNGPATAQERWEEEAGYSPSSIAAEIAGLACAGALAADTGHDADALVWTALADDWADQVEAWCATVTGGERHDAPVPYYLRVARDGDPDAGHRRTLANAGPTLDERDVIDAGFLDLVRLGIRPPDHPVVQNSLLAVDESIRVETPHGPGFYRYNGDGYGERGGDDAGAPWTPETGGIGRLWPLLTGERAEYALRAEDDEDPTDLLATLAGFANEGRMLPEQVWDRATETEYGWRFGEGTGAATPLAWAQAGFVRLAHGIDAGRPVGTPRVVEERYVGNETPTAPDLRVETRFVGGRLVVGGETDAAVVAVRTPADAALVEPEDGRFEAELAVESGENLLTVAAATGREIESAGTAVVRRRL